MPGSSAQLRLKSVNFIGMAVLFGVSCYFIYWGLGYIQHHHSALFVLAALFGIFMAFNIGGNDVARFLPGLRSPIFLSAGRGGSV